MKLRPKTGHIVQPCYREIAGARSPRLDRRRHLKVRPRASQAGPTRLDARTSGPTTTAPDRVVDRLTPRQREVLALMASGYSNAAIARQLVISERAVVQHTSQIYDRLDLFADDEIHRRVQAVVRYLSPTLAA
jgi:DNA-binding NarL/FixJ family response regulator